MSLIGLDIGTTGCRAALFSENGKPLGFEYREYPLVAPRQGWMELDSTLVLAKILECLHDLGAVESDDPPVALAVSSQGEAVTGVDSSGRIISNAIISMDVRSRPEVEELERRLGKEHLVEITGQPAHTMFTVPHLMWRKQHEPELFDRAVKWLTFEDLAATNLGSEPALDYSMAARTLAFDIRRRTWSEEIMEAAEISPNIFSAPVPSGTPIGTVTDASATELNLPRGLTIVAGGHDQPCSALGAGVVDEGYAADGLGTVECLTAVMNEPVISPAMRESNIPCYNHVVPGRYVALAYVLTGGSLPRWFRDTFGPLSLGLRDTDDFYQKALDLVAGETGGPSGLLVLPHFAGSGTPWLDPGSKGVVAGLTPSTRAVDLYRAFLEGTAMEMRENLDRLGSAGIQVKQVFATGGGARSKTLLQLKADITGRPITACRVTEASALGAAILAGVGKGVYKSCHQAVGSAVNYGDTVTPDPETHSEYEPVFQRYRKLYPRVRDLF